MKILPTLGSMMSGSLRGLTASHNKGGLYLRGRTVPTNPNTARQQDIRSSIGGLMQDWSMELSEAQREAWRQYAANVPVTDTLGQTMQLSGVNWFVKSQSLPHFAIMQGLSGASAVQTSDAPTTFNTGQPPAMVTTFQGDFATPPGTVDVIAELAAAPDAAGFAFLFIGAPQTPGVRFYKGPYQLAAGIAITATDPALSFSANLGTPTQWLSDIVPVAAWDGLYVPLRIVAMYEDGRRAQEWKMLMQFTDATP